MSGSAAGARSLSTRTRGSHSLRVRVSLRVRGLGQGERQERQTAHPWGSASGWRRGTRLGRRPGPRWGRWGGAHASHPLAWAHGEMPTTQSPGSQRGANEACWSLACVPKVYERSRDGLARPHGSFDGCAWGAATTKSADECTSVRSAGTDAHGGQDEGTPVPQRRARRLFASPAICNGWASRSRIARTATHLRRAPPEPTEVPEDLVVPPQSGSAPAWGTAVCMCDGDGDRLT